MGSFISEMETANKGNGIFAKWKLEKTGKGKTFQDT